MASAESATYESISQVPKSAIGALATMLAMPPSQLDAATGAPSPAWLAGQEAKLAALPKCLQLPRGLKGLSMKLAEKSRAVGLGASGPTVLCKAHDGLQPRLVRQVFGHLSREASDHADRIRRHQGPWRDDEAVRAWGDRLTGLCALWSDAAMFRLVAGKRFPEALRMPHLREACEACVLAAVGARGQVLADLRASLLSRMEVEAHGRRKREEKRAIRQRREGKVGGESGPAKARHLDSHPCIWYVVEAWIDLFGAHNAATLRAQSEVLAAPLFQVRKYEGKLRRAARKQHDAELGASKGRGMPSAQRKDALDRHVTADPTPRIKTRAGHRMPRPRPVEVTMASLSSSAASTQTWTSAASRGLPEHVREQMLAREQYRHVDGDYGGETVRDSVLDPMMYQVFDHGSCVASGDPRPDSTALPPAERRDRFSFGGEDVSDDEGSDDEGSDGDDAEEYPSRDEAEEYPSRDEAVTEHVLRGVANDDPADTARLLEHAAGPQAPTPTSFRCPSAIPSPLHIKRSTIPAGDDGNDRSFVSATVLTWDPNNRADGATSTPAPPVPPIPSTYANLIANANPFVPAPPSSFYSQDDLPAAVAATAAESTAAEPTTAAAAAAAVAATAAEPTSPISPRTPCPPPAAALQARAETAELDSVAGTYVPVRRGWAAGTSPPSPRSPTAPPAFNLNSFAAPPRRAPARRPASPIAPAVRTYLAAPEEAHPDEEEPARTVVRYENDRGVVPDDSLSVARLGLGQRRVKGQGKFARVEAVVREGRSARGRPPAAMENGGRRNGGRKGKGGRAGSSATQGTEWNQFYR